MRKEKVHCPCCNLVQNQEDDVIVPKTVREALCAKEWKEAMEKEMRNVVENEAWDVVRIPANMEVIGTQWAFQLKFDENFKVVKF
jgi:hypothetical protein